MSLRVMKLRPGDEVIAYCGRCKQERTHQIIGLNSGGQADRVICRFCQNSHRYRDGHSGERRVSKHAASTPLPPQREPLRYSGTEVYVKGDVIRHQKFGQGSVVVARGGKIDVRFGSEIRTLLHAG